MGESHRAWAEGYARHSRHEVTLMSLPGRHWKWRMHGAAETFARLYLERKTAPDLILATDMLDLAAFLAHTRTRTSHVPTAIYFHENQFAYPWSPDDPDPQLRRDQHYAFINYRSALVADRVFWNSTYNRDSFLEGLDKMLRAFPDHQELQNLDTIRKKSAILPLGFDFPPRQPRPQAKHHPPTIVWNHRWEYDKGPDLFFETLIDMDAAGIDFRLAVLGRRYSKTPPIFPAAQQKLAHKIVHWGYVNDLNAYHSMLAAADILPVTSQQDFFGASVVEAMYFDCVPLLPNALAFPAHIPQAHHHQVLWNDPSDFKEKLRQWVQEGMPSALAPSNWVEHYGWDQQAPLYDNMLEEMQHS